MAEMGEPKNHQRELGAPRQSKSITWRGVVIIIILAIIVLFILFNLTTVNVQLLAWSVDVWTWALVLIPFALGVLTGGMVRRGLRRLRKPKPGDAAQAAR